MLLLASLNANGLRTESKLVSILSALTFDILCLQETKWDDAKAREMGRLWTIPCMYVMALKRNVG